MELRGHNFCIFRRAVQVLLNEDMHEYILREDPKRLDLPILHFQDASYYGFLSIVERLLHYDKERDQDRMWLFILCTEFWSRGAKDIISHRILRHKVKGIKYPDVTEVRNARMRTRTMLEQINAFLKENTYLGSTFSSSDILCSSIIAFLDYSSEIQWPLYRELANWYSSIKGRPSFKFILDDKISGLEPPVYYNNIDFVDYLAISII